MFAYTANDMLSPTKKRVLQLQSEICKILSNPKRLEILHELRSGEMTVSELASSTGLRQANVSQHLALMRHQKIVIERRVGNTVFYRIADRRINEACDVMQTVLIDQVSADSKLVKLATASNRQ
jgi:DNA-binding transcriptional ArsR family regulator